MVEMEDTELGSTIRSHSKAHLKAATCEARLKTYGERLILLGTNLKDNPQNIRIEEEQIFLNNEGYDEQIIGPIDIEIILKLAAEFKEASQRERQLAYELKENGMDHVVDGLNNQQESTS